MSCSCKPFIQLKDVSFSYGKVEALHDVTGAFYEGSLTAVAGPNGAGKSTLLKVISGIVRPQKGQLILAPEITGRIGYLPQASAIEKEYPLTVWQAISTGLWPEVGSALSLRSSKMKARIQESLEEVGLVGLENRQVGELSGGQFQRMLFARLLLQDPKVVLLDEPFSAVDGPTTRKLMEILLGWHKDGRTIICILHDLMLIQKYFPESFVLAGKCLGRGHTHELLEQKLLSFDLDMAEIVDPEERHVHD